VLLNRACCPRVSCVIVFVCCVGLIVAAAHVVLAVLCGSFCGCGLCVVVVVVVVFQVLVDCSCVGARRGVDCRLVCSQAKSKSRRGRPPEDG
jgi:hypothetical protein